MKIRFKENYFHPQTIHSKQLLHELSTQRPDSGLDGLGSRILEAGGALELMKPWIEGLGNGRGPVEGPAPQALKDVVNSSAIQRSADGSGLQLTSSLLGPAGAALQFSQNGSKWSAQLSNPDGSSQALDSVDHKAWQLSDGTTVSLGYGESTIRFEQAGNSLSLQVAPSESEIRGAIANARDGDHYESVFYWAPGSKGVSGYSQSNQLSPEEVVSRVMGSF